eukprot:scaffold516_cov401-Prasinococcus_capsulatus_cf.AAC.3
MGDDRGALAAWSEVGPISRSPWLLRLASAPRLHPPALPRVAAVPGGPAPQPARRPRRSPSGPSPCSAYPAVSASRVAGAPRPKIGRCGVGYPVRHGSV